MINYTEPLGSSIIRDSVGSACLNFELFQLRVVSIFCSCSEWLKTFFAILPVSVILSWFVPNPSASVRTFLVIKFVLDLKFPIVFSEWVFYMTKVESVLWNPSPWTLRSPKLDRPLKQIMIPQIVFCTCWKCRGTNMNLTGSEQWRKKLTKEATSTFSLGSLLLLWLPFWLATVSQKIIKVMWKTETDEWESEL